MADTVGMWLGALLTIMVLSYLAWDTFFFRLASSLLVGSAIGYASAVILNQVLWKQLLVPLSSGLSSGSYDVWVALAVPLLLGVLLLAKLVPNWGGVGNTSLGFLFGVGAAVAIGGALTGTLAPQLNATAASLRDVGLETAINSLLIVIGVLGALLAFRFTSGLPGRLLRLYSSIVNVWGRIGRGFIMVAFGATFANVLTARISTLVGVLSTLDTAIRSFLHAFGINL